MPRFRVGTLSPEQELLVFMVILTGRPVVGGGRARSVFTTHCASGFKDLAKGGFVVSASFWSHPWKQAQAAKRASLIATTRIFNGMDGASRIIVVILLCQDVRTVDAVRALATSVTEDVDAIEGSIEDKTSLQFIPVHYHRYWEALDATKAANYAPFLLSPNVEVPEAGDTLFRTLRAQGLPAVVSAIPPDPSTSSFDQKSPTAILKSLFSFM
ncbi:hypothetical protein JVT61DRAFT_15595 [Boletus reticuloceps]|uniref:Uncharacterized protein n=1 Tax=Boletus reticuloceps TaxID=495285 RepID=A0A8I3A3N7_9AGAM|nr:hypothetical protein JVT61DRAFT_15595 [Boletus reticuloceps]